MSNKNNLNQTTWGIETGLGYSICYTFSVRYWYALVCLMSSDHETNVEAEVTSFCVAVLGYNLTRSPLTSFVFPTKIYGS